MADTDRRTVLAWLAAIPLARLLPACDSSSSSGADTGVGDADATADTTTPDTTVTDTVTADTSDMDTAVADTTEVDAGPQVCEPTTADAQGPFFEPNAPEVTDLAPDGEPGTPLALSGRILDEACAPIAGAIVEVWQADDAGEYHDGKLRATLTADADGRWAFRSIVPGPYFQASGFRPAHVHFRIRAAGYRTVVTQLYFEGDPYLSPNDSCGSCGSDDQDRIIALVDARGGGKQGVYEPVLAATG